MSLCNHGITEREMEVYWRHGEREVAEHFGSAIARLLGQEKP